MAKKATIKDIKDAIDEAFKNYLTSRSPELDPILNNLPNDIRSGKLYEAHVLALVAERLVLEENCTLTLKNGSHVYLKSSPGPINRNFPYIEVHRDGVLLGEMFTDVEFTTLSHYLSNNPPQKSCYYHELDILLTKPNPNHRPYHHEILLGIECKNTAFQKSLYRAALGVRRELSLLSDSTNTSFRQWPSTILPCNPASCFIVFGSDDKILNYTESGAVFGIQFVYSDY